MNTTIQALQDLYVKLGGELTDTYNNIANGISVSDYATIPDMIEACVQIVGSDGRSGESVIAWKPTVSAEGVISWTRTASTTPPESQNIRGPQGETGQRGETGPQGQTGATGEQGAEGFSPTVTIERNQANNGVVISITDETGTTTAQVLDGSKITVSQLYTLSANGWSNKTQTVFASLNTANRNVIDITLGENSLWDSCGVYPTAETANGITFVCETVPSTDLTFKVTSMEVS